MLPEDVTARQKLLEESVYDVAVQRLKHESELIGELGIQSGVKDVNLRKWMWDWHIELTARLKNEISNIIALEERRNVNRTGSLGPYLHLVNAERLSLITIMEIMSMNGAGRSSEGMKTTRVLVHLGRAVEMEYKAQMAKKNNIAFPVSGNASKSGGYFSNMGYNFLLERRIAAAKYMEEGEVWTATWTQPIRAKIGGVLMECLMDAAIVKRSRTDPKTFEVQCVVSI